MRGGGSAVGRKQDIVVESMEEDEGGQVEAEQPCHSETNLIFHQSEDIFNINLG